MSVFTRKEYLEAKRLLVKYEGRVATVATAMKRSEATIRKVKRSTSYPKFLTLNKSIQDARKTKPEVSSVKDVANATIEPNVWLAEQARLLDKLYSPQKRSKKHAAEVLDLRTRHASQLRKLDEQITAITKDRDHYKRSYEAAEKSLKAQIGENIRLSRLLNKRPLWKRAVSRVRNGGTSVADEN